MMLPYGLWGASTWLIFLSKVVKFMSDMWSSMIIWICPTYLRCYRISSGNFLSEEDSSLNKSKIAIKYQIIMNG